MLVVLILTTVGIAELCTNASLPPKKLPAGIVFQSGAQLLSDAVQDGLAAHSGLQEQASRNAAIGLAPEVAPAGPSRPAEPVQWICCKEVAKLTAAATVIAESQSR